jgi:hypothetical protein
LNTIQALISLSIALRAFYLYRKIRNDDLVILGTALITITAASLSALVADNIFASTERAYGGTFNVQWFEYGGQTVGYLFIWLSSLQGPTSYLSRLRRWQIGVTMLLVVVLFLTPIIPPFPSPIPQALLSVTRSIVCFIIFLRYLAIFFKKESRFSFLMALAFLLLTFGIIIITSQFFPNGPIVLVYTGYALRLSGLISFLLAFLLT